MEKKTPKTCAGFNDIALTLQVHHVLAEQDPGAFDEPLSQILEQMGLRL